MASEEFDALIRLMRETSEEAVLAAEDAAAEVYRSVIQAAAPHRTGQLEASVKIIEGRPGKGLTGDTRRRLFVGPEKKKGYYGYWGEHGWKHPIGPKVSYTTERGDRWNKAGHTYTTGALKRGTGKAAHSQMGTEQYKQIPARPWFDAAVKSADAGAEQAATEAFNAKLEEIDARS